MHLGPLCLILYIKLKGVLILQQSSRWPPILNSQLPPGKKKKRSPGINVEVTMYGCFLPELYLTGVLRRILTGVPCYILLHDNTFFGCMLSLTVQ